jgi:Phage tail protein
LGTENGTSMSGFAPSTVTPPSLSDWQFQFNGLTFGVDTAYALIQADGLDMPVVRTSDVSRPRDTGQFIGIDLLDGRDITLTLDMTTNGTSLQNATTAFATAFVPPATGQTESLLWMSFPNLPLLVCSARVRKRAISIDLPWSVDTGFVKAAVVSLHCTDPRVYSGTTATTVNLPTPPGGMTFPATFPLAFGGGSTAGVITCNNTGNIEMRPIITITGPVTNPTVENATTGYSLTFSNPNQTSYTLNSGDQLVIDTDLHQVTYYPSGSTSGSSRRNWLVYGSTWWDLPAGTTSTINFSSDDASLPSPVPTCQVEFAPAYISVT